MKRGSFSFLYPRKAQVTIFVIVALILIVGIGGYFIFKDRLFKQNIPSQVAPIYKTYTSCVEGIIYDGSKIMGSQAGYIQTPEFEPGSTYAPFSNQLSFLGAGIPYWYYLSSNNVIKEQVPTIKIMEQQLENYVNNQIVLKCNNLDSENQGYNITFGNVKTKIKINDNSIDAQINQKLQVQKGEFSFIITNHIIEFDSRLGEFYNQAKEIYNHQKDSMFLENYSLDVLYTYAPVSGIEINCSPIVWDPYTVFSNLQEALQANIGLLKVQGDYYETKQKYSKYFVAGKGSNLNIKNKQINFIYSKDFASRFEVWPTSNNLMIANPIGTQEGLSALGFCFVPYKFVYDMYFPVLVQVMSDDGSELFQFPFAVVINKNMGRESLVSETLENVEDLCSKSNKEISIYTYDVNLNPVEADLQFKCLTSVCNLGKTKIDNTTGNSFLEVEVPQCLNGVLIAKSKGYSDKKYFISTNEEDQAEIVLDKQYELPLEIYVDNSLVSNMALFSINSNNENITELVSSATYPYTNKIKISEGDLRFELNVFKSGSYTIPSTTKRQCTAVAEQGILGLFGFEDENCFDITIPSQQVTNFVYAGGYMDNYISQSQLENAKVIKVYAKSVKNPVSIEELQILQDQIKRSNIEVEII